MIGSGQAYISPQGQTLMEGVTVSDMVSDDLKISPEGAVTGAINYISKAADYPPDQQTGHFFPTVFPPENYKPLHVGGKPDGGSGFTAGKDFTPSADDPYLIIRVENCTDENKVTIYDATTRDEVLTLDFSGATLEPPVGKDAVGIADQEKDFGAFGKASSMVEPGISIAWDGINGRATGKLKWFEGNDKVEAGNNLPVVLNEWFKTNRRTVGAYVNNKKQIAGETEWIVHLTSTEKPVTVMDGETIVATIDLTGLTLATNPSPISLAAEERSEVHTAEDLRAMKVAEIKSLASAMGYSIKSTKKDDVIAEFLEQQG